MGSTPTRPKRRPFRPPLSPPVLVGALLLAACATTDAPRAPHTGGVYVTGDDRPRADLLLKEVEAQVLAAQDAQIAFLGAYPVEGLERAEPHVAEVHAALGRARAALAAVADLDDRPGVYVPAGCCDALDAGLSLYENRFRALVALAGRRGDGSSGLLLAAADSLTGLERYLDRLEGDEATPDAPSERTDAIRAIRSDVDAIRRFEAAYLLRDDLGGIVSIGDRVVSQRAFLAESPLEARERARVDTHVRTYLIYLEGVAVTDVEIYRAKRDLRITTTHIQALVHHYTTGADVPLPAGIAI